MLILKSQLYSGLIAHLPSLKAALLIFLGFSHHSAFADFMLLIEIHVRGVGLCVSPSYRREICALLAVTITTRQDGALYPSASSRIFLEILFMAEVVDKFAMCTCPEGSTAKNHSLTRARLCEKEKPR